MEREIKSFDDMKPERYCAVKDSVESLMEIMDLEGLTKSERTRVLTALVQLINDNSDKPMDLRIEDTRDMIYNGNVFSHYFKHEDKDNAVEILSNTTLLNELERLIYTINFYMPNDKEFLSVYKQCGKDVSAIAKHYGLDGEDASKFVCARVTEFAKFHSAYKAYKEEQTQVVSESQVFMALQEAEDNPTLENIERVRGLIMGLQNEGLKEELRQQLEMLGANALSNQEIGEYWDIPEEPVTSYVGMEDAAPIFGFSPEEDAFNIESSLANQTDVTLKDGTEPLGLYVQETTDYLEPATEFEEEPVVEPAPLEVANGTDTEVKTDNVAEEVTSQLKLFVTNSKKNTERLEGELARVQEELDGTQEELSRANALAEEQAKTIAMQSDKIIDFEAVVRERDAQIDDLESKNERLHAENEMQAEKIEEQKSKIIDFEAELQRRNVHIGELKTANDTLHRKVIFYQDSFEEVKAILGTQDLGEPENVRKVA